MDASDDFEKMAGWEGLTMEHLLSGKVEMREGKSCVVMFEDRYDAAVAWVDEARAALNAALEELSQSETTPEDRTETLAMVRSVLEKLA